MFKYVFFQEYEVKSNIYRGALNDDEVEDDKDDEDDQPVLKKRQTMAQAVQRKVQRA